MPIHQKEITKPPKQDLPSWMQEEALGDTPPRKYYEPSVDPVVHEAARDTPGYVDHSALADIGRVTEITLPERNPDSLLPALNIQENVSAHAEPGIFDPFYWGPKVYDYFLGDKLTLKDVPIGEGREAIERFEEAYADQWASDILSVAKYGGGMMGVIAGVTGGIYDAHKAWRDYWGGTGDLSTALASSAGAIQGAGDIIIPPTFGSVRPPPLTDEYGVPTTDMIIYDREGNELSAEPVQRPVLPDSTGYSDAEWREVVREHSAADNEWLDAAFAKEPWQMTPEEFGATAPDVEGYLFHGSETSGIDVLGTSYGHKGLPQGQGVFTANRRLASGYGSPGRGLYYVRNNPEKVLDWDEPMDRELWERIREKVIKAQESTEFPPFVGFIRGTWTPSNLQDLVDQHEEYHGGGVLTNGEAWRYILQPGEQDERNLSSDVMMKALVDEGYDATVYSFDDAWTKDSRRSYRHSGSELITVFLTDKDTISAEEVWRDVVGQAIEEGKDIPQQVLDEYYAP